MRWHHALPFPIDHALVAGCSSGQTTDVGQKTSSTCGAIYFVVPSARWDGVRPRKGGNDRTPPGPLIKIKILEKFEENSLQSKRAKRRLRLDFGFDAGGCRSRRVLRRGGVNHLQPNSVSS
jgi:hypothetical protein